jgi:tetratricopeptide (TPR) repeat protein
MPAFAANVAQKLIEIGVRCVIAAGWAVDDDAALTFARTFYRHIRSGRRFVDAVGEARALTYRLSPRSNTWAAYQCYGDPDWTFVPGRSGGGASRSWPKVASDRGLILRLETLAVEYQFSGRNAEDVHMELRNLLDNGNPAWFKRGEVAAAFGRAYGEIGDFENAVQWYTVAVRAEDGGAGLRALEQLGNMRARLGEKIYRRDPDDASERARALAIVEEGIELLKKAAAIAPTTERDSLLGSAYKRLAEISGGGERSRAALEQALVYYRSAEKVALGGGGDLFYPALNSLSLELRLRSHGRKSSQRFEAARIDAIRESIEQKNQTNADFWSVIGRTELMVYEALDAGRLAGVVEAAIAELRDVAKRVTSQRKWDSVVFQMRVTLEDYLKTPALPAQERAATGRLLAQMPGNEVKPAASGRERSKAAARPRAKKKARAHR